MQSERLFFGMLVTSLALHVALFVIPEWFGSSTDAAPLPVSRGRVTIRLNRMTVEEPKPREVLDTPIEKVERLVQPLPPRPPTELPSPAIVAARPQLERLEQPDETPVEPAQRIERQPTAKPDPTKLDELELHAVGQEGADVDEPASAFYNPLPPYPASALRRREGTVVVLRISVTAAGTADSAGVAQSCGDPAVDESTRAFVAKHWRFRPAKRRGVAVRQVVEVLVRYK
jgi:TonB family protein